MNIGVIGLGYVGLANALYLAKKHTIYGYDIDASKINSLQQKDAYLFEDNFQEYLEQNNANLNFFHDIASCLKHVHVIIVAVPTPQAKDGRCDLSALMEVVGSVAQLANKNTIFIIRSTVIPGTHQQVLNTFKSLHREDIIVVSMPEFLALGSAIKDMEKPRRIILGSHHQDVFSIVKNMYGYPTDVPYVITTPETAELIKYASNTLLATKVSLMNEISQISEAVGAEIESVIEGIGLDPRIGPHFLNPGLGFGGSCFPKDLKALHMLAKDHQLEGLVLKAALKSNQDQTIRFTKRILNRFQGNISGKKIAVLGLAYKGATADVRNSPAFTVIDMLTDQKAQIFAYDKKATFAFFECRGEKPCLAYANEIEDALIDADCAIIINDAEEIKALTAETFIRLMKTPIVFDGKNLFKVKAMEAIEYHSVGRRLDQ
jgi:UDPglucose 6-dehydrogenase